MNEADHASSRTWLWTTVILAMLPVLYLLSIGPFVYLDEKHALPAPAQHWMIAFYVPLGWLYDHTPLKEPLDLYVEWWERLAHRT
jgi:hypothetical protein